MSSDPQDPEPTPEEIRLGELADRYQELRTHDPRCGVGMMRDEAETLFYELSELAECIDLLRVGCGLEAETVPHEVGPYRIEALLGSGVTGKVYRASRGDGGEPVALKVLRPNLVLDASAAERFRREVRIAERLEHANSVRVLDHGEIDGRAYIAMDLLEGETLAALATRLGETGSDEPTEAWLALLDQAGAPPAPDPSAPVAERYARRLAGLFAPAARAVAAAARIGLVHRDLKPGNLFLSRDGRLVVLDFGLAKIVGEEITSTLAILGTPGFMSPEQAAGRSRDVDARTDVYGLGASLYRVLTLRHPVEGESFNEVLAGILEVVPEPITARCPGYPRELGRVLARCLEKDPGDRYPDADALADDLERVAEGRAPQQASVPAGRRAAKLGRRYGAVTTAAVLCIVAGYFWLTRPGTVEIEAWPGGIISVDGEVVGEDRWTERLPPGTYRLSVSRPGYETWKRAVEVDAGGAQRCYIRLDLVDEYDPAGLADLAAASGLENVTSMRELVALSMGSPRRLRSVPEERPIPPPERPGALGERLERWPEPERRLPSRRMLAIQELRRDELPLAAYHAAVELWREDRSRVLPLQQALDALTEAGFEETSTYEELLEALLELVAGPR